MKFILSLSSSSCAMLLGVDLWLSKQVVRGATKDEKKFLEGRGHKGCDVRSKGRQPAKVWELL